jgi:hypothetical protein
MAMREALTPPVAFMPQATKIRTNSILRHFPKLCTLCIADGTSDHRRNDIKLQPFDK